MINNFPTLSSFSLSGNYILSLFNDEGPPEKFTFQTLLNLDLSFVEMNELDSRSLRPFPNLQFLNLSHCHVHHIKGQGFQPIKSLQTLHVTGCHLMSIPKTMFLGLDSMRRVFADNYKCVVMQTLPGFVFGTVYVGCHMQQCHMQGDGFLVSDVL